MIEDRECSLPLENIEEEVVNYLIANNLLS
jgi:hypothetical protein